MLRIWDWSPSSTLAIGGSFQVRRCSLGGVGGQPEYPFVGAETEVAVFGPCDWMLPPIFDRCWANQAPTCGYRTRSASGVSVSNATASSSVRRTAARTLFLTSTRYVERDRTQLD